MTFLEAYTFFAELKIETQKKSERKIYQKFLHTLTELDNKDLSIDEIKTIESKLDKLNLQLTSDTSYFKKAYRDFEEYLRETFSLISKNYYTNLYVGLGSSFGILFSVIFLTHFERSLGIVLGLSVGMIFGAFIGQSRDRKAQEEGRVI